MSQGTMIDVQSPGKAGLIVGLSEEMGLVELFNEKLSSNRERPYDIPNGVMAQMMMVNMCNDHHPLWPQQTKARPIGKEQKALVIRCFLFRG